MTVEMKQSVNLPVVKPHILGFLNCLPVWFDASGCGFIFYPMGRCSRHLVRGTLQAGRATPEWAYALPPGVLPTPGIGPSCLLTSLALAGRVLYHWGHLGRK